MPGMAHDRAVILLGRAARLPPLEVHHRVGAVGDRLVALQAHHARALERVVRRPLHLAGRLLHQQPRLPALQAAHQIVAEGHLAGVLGPLRVGVPGDHVEVRRPGEVVERLVGAHHVGGDRHLRRHRAQDLRLGLVALQLHVGHEAPVIEHLALDALSPSGPGGIDLLPGGVGVAPEGGVQRLFTSSRQP